MSSSSLFAAAAAALLAAAPILPPPPAGPGLPVGASAVVRQVSAAAAEAPAPDAGRIGAALAGALSDHPGTAHVSVRDAVTGEALYGQGQDEEVAPASSLKLLTAATALRTLGPERRFRTRTVLIDPARPAVQVQPQPADTWQPAAPAAPDPAVTWAPPQSTWQPSPSWQPPSSTWTPEPTPTPTEPAPAPVAPSATSAPTPTPSTNEPDAGAGGPSSSPEKEPAQLVLVGGGDVLLGTGASDGTRVDGRAGLATLAEQTVQGLQEQGVTGEVELTLDLRLYPGDGVNPAWDPSLLEDGYISAVQPLATFGGRPEAGTGEERLADPAGFAAQRFQALLQGQIDAAGADIDLRVRDDVPRTDLPRALVEEADPVAEVHSAPLREQVRYLLAHSDNQLAEALARNAAYAVGRTPDHRGAAELMADVAADLGADPEGLEMVDAGGLSGRNRISAADLTQVLAASARTPLLGAVLEELATPGSDSTLSERLVGTAAEDTVAAKTGTLLESVSLTGRVVTTRGRVLLFSVVLSGVDSQVADARAATDRVAVALAGL